MEKRIEQMSKWTILVLIVISIVSYLIGRNVEDVGLKNMLDFGSIVPNFIIMTYAFKKAGEKIVYNQEEKESHSKK
jgi:membrane protein CcdC involved in cytochrome C biogenesis